jgi:serine phosphatase RsbU (regulator of sigma subunit)/HAMP domain-containing protein
VIGDKLKGLRGRFLLLVVAIYVVIGAASLFGFFSVAENIIAHLGAGYATQYANQQRGRIIAKIERELVLTQKLVASPLLRKWTNDEFNPALKSAAIDELESFRSLFADHSYFFVIAASRDYYTNNSKNEFGGQEFRFVLKPDDPTMAWYFATMEHVDDFDLHVDYDTQLDVTKIWINAIVKQDGKKIGMGGTGLDLSDFLKSIVHTSDTGVENVLIDADGFVEGHSDRSLMDSIAHTSDEAARLTIFNLIDNEAERGALRQLLQRMKNGEIHDAQTELTIHGDRRLAAISYMPEIHWAAVVLVDPSQVIRLETFRPILFLMAAALLLTILLVSWLLDRLVLNRLARLIGLTREIAAGQYDRKLAVDRDDEIGQLTHSFNAMTTTIGDYMQNLEQKVTHRTEELQQANSLLEASNRKVMDSIEYARLIQSSILAKDEDLADLVREYSVLWRPRDIVGGDFYCVYRAADGGFLLAVADCTGHGVPGAFMTMASKALLDHAVAMRGANDPAAVIGELHRGLRALLQSRYASDADNGLDIALLYVAPQRNSLTYAGAKLALWVIDAQGRITQVPGNRTSVGYRKTPNEVLYTNHVVAHQAGQRYVLLTDGILDQHGGAKRFAYGQARLKASLSAFASRPLTKLADTLAEVLRAYQGDLPQRDDITLIGISLD